MTQPVYTVADIAHMTGFSEIAIRRAITQHYSDRRTGKECRPLPPLRAKRGPGKQYLVLACHLSTWLDQLEDA